VALVLGATIMFDSDLPEFRLSIPLIAGVAVASLAAIVVTVRFTMSARRSRVAAGKEDMIGAVGTVLDWSGGRGHVRVKGERWRAVGGEGFRQGQPVRIDAIEGLTLTVEPAE
jgi:membrane-bound serine protease (ClpP class)